PSRCPGENDGRRELSTSPPVGFGMGATSGRMEHAKKTSASRPTGRASWSRRHNLLERAGVASSGMAAEDVRTSVTAIADPRVEHGVQNVSHQVGEHGDNVEHEHDRLHDDVVAGEDPLQEVLADP